jgi:nitrogen regulatory protein PII
MAPLRVRSYDETDSEEERSLAVGELTLHPMKEIRVIVAGEHRAFVTELLDLVKASGYTIIGNVSGKGHHGVREAHFMFSEQESLEMIMAVVPEEKVKPILAGLRPLFDRHSGVMFVADVAVSREEYFGTKPPGA